MKKALIILWDILYPLVFFYLCLAVVTIAAIIIAGLATGTLEAEGIIARAPITAVLINIAFYSITIVTQRKVYQKDSYRFGEQKNHWNVLQLILSAAVALGLSLLLNYLILKSPLPDIFPSYEQSATASFEGQPWPLLILAVVVIGPVAEELIFRGLIYNRLRHYVKVPLAILLSSLLFGIYHGNMIQFIYTTLMGILLAIYYEKSGGLLACIIAHMAMNAAAVTSYI